MSAESGRCSFKPSFEGELQTLIERCSGDSLQQLHAMTEEIERARVLLADSLSELRDDFELIMPLAGPQDRLPIERAIVALQSEDVVGQMLTSIRERSICLARILERLAPVTWMLAREVARNRDAAGVHWIRTQLGELSRSLQAMHVIHQPVSQTSVASGPVELF